MQRMESVQCLIERKKALFHSCIIYILTHFHPHTHSSPQGRIFLAPFFPVTFPDFWIADQMNSLAVVFLDIEFFLCYMVYGLHFSNFSIHCGSVTYVLRPLVAVLPAWFRFAQCLRRYYDTRSAFPHLVNAGKYSTSFFVVFFSSLATGLKGMIDNA